MEDAIQVLLIALVFATFLTMLQLKKEWKMALDALQSAVADQTTVINGAVTLLDGLAAKIAALTPTQAAIDSLAAEVKASRDALAAAVVRDTQAADEPPAPIEPSGNAPG